MFDEFYQTNAQDKEVSEPVQEHEILSWVVYPLLIFIAKIIDVALATMRIVFVSKNKKYLASIIGFIEILLWLVIISHVVKNLENPLNYLAYALGYAVGNWSGMKIENKLAMGMSMIRVITAKEGTLLVSKLRDLGQVVTDVPAFGNLGPVRVIFMVIKRRELKSIISIIKEFNPNAFYTVEDVGFVSKIYPIPKKEFNYAKIVDNK